MDGWMHPDPLAYNQSPFSDTACRFHIAPPIFHDTRKGWGCCEKRVYDWDEFEQLKGENKGENDDEREKANPGVCVGRGGGGCILLNVLAAATRATSEVALFGGTFFGQNISDERGSSNNSLLDKQTRSQYR